MLQKFFQMALVLHDNPGFRTELQKALSSLGMEVIKSGSVDQGYKEIAKARRTCDLIICDMEMSEMNGLQLMSAIRKNKRFRKTSIAMVMAKELQDNVPEALKFGLFQYFYKPVGTDVMINQMTLRRVILESFGMNQDVMNGINQAQYMMDKGEYDRAVEILETIEEVKEHPQLKFMKGKAERFAEDHHGASQTFAKALALDKNLKVPISQFLNDHPIDNSKASQARSQASKQIDHRVVAMFGTHFDEAGRGPYLLDSSRYSMILSSDFGLRTTLKANLNDFHPHDIDMFESANEVINQIKGRPPGLLVTDLVLGDSNSLGLIKHIRTGFNNTKMHIIVGFDENMLGNVEAAIKQGANGVYVKPYSASAIGRAIDAAHIINNIVVESAPEAQPGIRLCLLSFVLDRTDDINAKIEALTGSFGSDAVVMLLDAARIHATEGLGKAEALYNKACEAKPALAPLEIYLRNRQEQIVREEMAKEEEKARIEEMKAEEARRREQNRKEEAKRQAEKKARLEAEAAEREAKDKARREKLKKEKQKRAALRKKQLEEAKKKKVKKKKSAKELEAEKGAVAKKVDEAYSLISEDVGDETLEDEELAALEVGGNLALKKAEQSEDVESLEVDAMELAAPLEDDVEGLEAEDLKLATDGGDGGPVTKKNDEYGISSEEREDVDDQDLGYSLEGGLEADDELGLKQSEDSLEVSDIALAKAEEGDSLEVSDIALARSEAEDFLEVSDIQLAKAASENEEDEHGLEVDNLQLKGPSTGDPGEIALGDPDSDSQDQKTLREQVFRLASAGAVGVTPNPAEAAEDTSVVSWMEPEALKGLTLPHIQTPEADGPDVEPPTPQRLEDYASTTKNIAEQAQLLSGRLAVALQQDKIPEEVDEYIRAVGSELMGLRGTDNPAFQDIFADKKLAKLMKKIDKKGMTPKLSRELAESFLSNGLLDKFYEQTIEKSLVVERIQTQGQSGLKKAMGGVFNPEVIQTSKGKLPRTFVAEVIEDNLKTKGGSTLFDNLGSGQRFGEFMRHMEEASDDNFFQQNRNAKIMEFLGGKVDINEGGIFQIDQILPEGQKLRDFMDDPRGIGVNFFDALKEANATGQFFESLRDQNLGGDFLKMMHQEGGISNFAVDFLSTESPQNKSLAIEVLNQNIAAGGGVQAFQNLVENRGEVRFANEALVSGGGVRVLDQVISSPFGDLLLNRLMSEQQSGGRVLAMAAEVDGARNILGQFAEEMEMSIDDMLALEDQTALLGRIAESNEGTSLLESICLSDQGGDLFLECLENQGSREVFFDSLRADDHEEEKAQYDDLAQTLLKLRDPIEKLHEKVWEGKTQAREELPDILDAYEADKDEETLHKKLDQILEEDMFSLQLFKTIYRTMHNRGMKREAVVFFNRHYSKYAKNKEMRESLLAFLDNPNEEEEKLSLLEESLKEDKNNYEYVMDLAVTALKLKKFKQVKRWCKKMISIDPKKGEAYNLLGISLKKQKKTRAAIRQYKKGIKQDESNPKLYHNLAISLAALGKDAECKAALRKAKELGKT